MLYLMTEFIVGGRQYIYRSPIMVSAGQYVLVNVFGEIKAVRVVSVSQTNDTDYDGEIKPIVGVGYMLEDLDQPVKKQTRPKRRSIDRADICGFLGRSLMRRPPMPKRFSWTDRVPVEPLRVLTGKLETPGEISKRTGLRHDLVCAALVAWAGAGQIHYGRIGTSDCSIPVFRLKMVWDR